MSQPTPSKNREHQRKWYLAHKEEQSRRVLEDRKKSRKLLLDARCRNGCVKCGELHPACLDFHHVDPSTKLFTLCVKGINGHGRKAILEEIKKCIVLCSNCHRKEHWEERNKAPIV